MFPRGTHRLNVSSSIVSVLYWWRKNKSVYSSMAAVTHCFLSIPATSVPWERLFSATRYLSGNQDRGYSWSKWSLDRVPGLDVRTRNEIYQELTFLLPTCGSALGYCLFCVFASVGVFKHREQMNMKTQISRPTWKPKPTKSLYSFSYFQHICLLWSLIDSASEMYLHDWRQH